MKKVYKDYEAYPSFKEVKSYALKVERLWRPVEAQVLGEVSKTSGLQWKEEKLPCYVVGRGAFFSYPLTLSVMEKKPSFFIDSLVHELVHNLFIQNEGKVSNSFAFFHKKYAKESWNTRIHVPLIAIHWLLLRNVFGEKRLKENLNFAKPFHDYKRAWEIVESEGAEIVVKEFKKRLK